MASRIVLGCHSPRRLACAFGLRHFLPEAPTGNLPAWVDNYVTKPIKPEVLAEVLRRWLGDRGAARPADR